MARRLALTLAGLFVCTSARADEARPESPSARADAPTTDTALLDRLEQLERQVAALSAQAAARSETERREVAAQDRILEPTLLGSVDYRVVPSEFEGTTGFGVSRLRPGLLFAPAPWLRAVVTSELAGEYPIILDAFARFRVSDEVEITAGYSKPPLFASFLQEPVQALAFPDRSPVVGAFRVRRDAGVDVRFLPRRVPIEAWLRVGNGSGSPLGNDDPMPAGYAALDLVLGRASPHARPGSEDPGLRLGASALLERVRDRDGIAGQTPLGFVYYRPVVVSGARVVAEGHAIAYAGPLRMTLEGAIAHESRSRDDDGNPSTPRHELQAMRSYGASAELAWTIRGVPRGVGTIPHDRPHEGRSWSGGALELAARIDGLWLGRGASDVRAGGALAGAVALTWWPTGYASATLAGYFTHYDVAPIESPDTRRSWGSIARLAFFWGRPGGPRAFAERGGALAP